MQRCQGTIFNVKRWPQHCCIAFSFYGRPPLKFNHGGLSINATALGGISSCRNPARSTPGRPRRGSSQRTRRMAWPTSDLGVGRRPGQSYHYNFGPPPRFQNFCSRQCSHILRSGHYHIQNVGGNIGTADHSDLPLISDHEIMILILILILITFRHAAGPATRTSAAPSQAVPTRARA